MHCNDALSDCNMNVYVHICTCMYIYVHVCTCMYMYSLSSRCTDNVESSKMICASDSATIITV